MVPIRSLADDLLRVERASDELDAVLLGLRLGDHNPGATLPSKAATQLVPIYIGSRTITDAHPLIPPASVGTSKAEKP